MNRYRGIGLMSGTSLDGVDLAFCSFTEKPDGSWKHEILATDTISYPEKWKNRLATIQNASAETYARTDSGYGKFLGSILAKFIAENRIEPEFIASHGHTIFHQPEIEFTAQIGNGETIAADLPCPLVTDFRTRDLALGGQGAPLVPFGEQFLFPDCSLFLNLGGFSNIAADGIGYDLSPCNFALNLIAKKQDPNLEFDSNGDLARSGTCIPDLLEELNDLPYYKKSPPKSLGREWFEQHFLPILEKYENLPPKDLLNTLSRHIARQIGKAVEKTEIRNRQILITGGGFKNGFLAEQIEKELRPFGIDFHPKNNPELIEYKEALIFAFLGLQTLLNRPNILTSATGARHASIAGSIHLPNPENRTIEDPLSPFR